MTRSTRNHALAALALCAFSALGCVQTLVLGESEEKQDSEVVEIVEDGPSLEESFEPVQAAYMVERSRSNSWSIGLMLTDAGDRLGCLAGEDTTVVPAGAVAQLWLPLEYTFFDEVAYDDRTLESICPDAEFILVDRGQECGRAVSYRDLFHVGGDYDQCAYLRVWSEDRRSRDSAIYRSGLVTLSSAGGVCRIHTVVVDTSGVERDYTFELDFDPSAPTQCAPRVFD